MTQNPKFGPFGAQNAHFRTNFLSQKSGFVTFFHLLTANLKQKKKKEKTDDGKYENFCHSLTDRLTVLVS